MLAAVVAAAGLLGLLVGSFANVAIHRIPAGGSIVTPRSACPDCGTEIRARDNVPVVSWVVLRARCRECAAPISARYPLIELLVGALWAATAAVHGLTWLLPALLAFVWILVVVAAIDLELRIIPNRISLKAPVVLLPLLALAAWQEDGWADLRRAVIAGIGLPLGMFVLAEGFRLLRGKVGMGMGDVKFALSLGLVLGYLGGLELLIGVYGAIISAVLVAVGLMMAGRARLASRIPFGPYLALGALLAVLAGEPLRRPLAGFLGL